MKTLFTLLAASLCLAQSSKASTADGWNDAPTPSQPGIHGSSRTGESVLVVRDFLPWNGDVVPVFLAANTVVTEIPTTALASTDLSPYCMVFVTAGMLEPFSLTSIRLNNARNHLAAYVEAGGTVLYQTGTWGATMRLPGGVLSSQQYESFNEFTGHNQLSGNMPFPEFYCDYASHDILTNLPTDTDTLITTRDGAPTAVRYLLGAGRVVAMTQPLEAFLPGGNSYGAFPYMMTLEENAIDYARSLGNCGDVVIEAQDTPVAFELKGNHPNPFNPTTTIAFSLAETANVTLAVYSLSGAKLATLIDGMTERGEHQVSFNGEALGSGLYLYRLEAMGQVQSGRMLLVK